MKNHDCSHLVYFNSHITGIPTQSLYSIQAVLYSGLTMIFLNQKYNINPMLKDHPMDITLSWNKFQVFNIADKAFHNLDLYFLSKSFLFIFQQYQNICDTMKIAFSFIHCRNLHLLLHWFLMAFFSSVQHMNHFRINRSF